MLGRLRNVAPFNSKQSSTRDLANDKHLSSEKRFYCLIIMYYIASLAKFGNCCSMVWARRQGQWKGKNFGISFSEEAAKQLRVVFIMYFRM